jgi:hypothetical protein
MASIINALSSGTGGIVTSGDASGILQLQTANTAAVTIDGSQQVSIGSSTNYNGGGFGTNLSIYGSGSAATTYTKTGQQYQIGVNSASNLGFYDPTHSTYMTAMNQYGIGVGTAVPSSGFGIAFPATQSASSDANTLDDYEEGTWTPTDNSGAGLSFTTSATYVKVGQIVIAYCQINYPSTANGNGAAIAGLPFTTASQDVYGGFTRYSTSQYIYPTLAQGSTYGSLYNTSGGQITNATLSSKRVDFTYVYRSNS